jgi:hypothetical protein
MFFPLFSLVEIMWLDHNGLPPNSTLGGLSLWQVTNHLHLNIGHSSDAKWHLDIGHPSYAMWHLNIGHLGR